MGERTSRAYGLRRGALALAAGALAAVVGGLGPAVAIDDGLYRALQGWSSPDQGPPVAVVGLDGAGPWRNGRTAELLERLQATGVRGIALDLPLASHARDPAGDARLVRSLLDTRVVLGVTLRPGEDGRPEASMPPVEFADATRLGHVRLPLDRDGRVREHLPHLVGSDGIRWPSLVVALAASGDAPGTGRADDAERWRVDYAGGMLPRTLSASGLLHGDIDTGLLRDHWVLVGVTDPARLAPVRGPYGSPALYPVEHEARALASLLEGTVATPLPAAVQALLSMLLAGGAVFIGAGRRRLAWRMPLALLAGIACAVLLASSLLHGQRWFGAGGVVLVLAAALAGCGALALRRHLRGRRRLPGLATRRRLAAAVHAVRAAGAPHALLLLDAPGGPASGSQDSDGSRCIARLLRERARRPGDLAAHLGDGRFALLLPGTSATAAERILEDIRAQADGTDGALRVAGSIHACTGEGCDCLHHLAAGTAHGPA